MYRTHEMRMVRIEESGLEEWACPTCGRRMLLRWPPHYEKRVVEPGDERACHVGSSADASTAVPDDPRDITTDHPPGPPPATPPEVAAETPTEVSAGAPQEASERRWHNARRWLRETGVDAHPTPPPPHAQPRLDNSEPV
ncbi:hypothetical protein OHR68_15875 [Spirillospora sp. NBC_00431]